MKILKHGTPPEEPKKFWAGERMHCDFCGCDFELEEDDHVTTWRDSHPLNPKQTIASGIAAPCPECHLAAFKAHSSALAYSQVSQRFLDYKNRVELAKADDALAL